MSFGVEEGAIHGSPSPLTEVLPYFAYHVGENGFHRFVPQVSCHCFHPGRRQQLIHGRNGPEDLLYGRIHDLLRSFPGDGFWEKDK